jgi:hypothetical protein
MSETDGFEARCNRVCEVLGEMDNEYEATLALASVIATVILAYNGFELEAAQDKADLLCSIVKDLMAKNPPTQKV